MFSVLQLALLVLSSTKSRRFGAFFIPSDAVTLVAALCMVLLSYMEHSRALRPSILLNAYLFITLLFDISQVRTLWLVSSNADEIAFTRIFTCGVAVKALLIVLESQAKARWIVRWDVKEHSPEETTGLYGLGAYFWLNRLLLRGYRKVLEIPDLFPLDQNMAAETLHVKLAHHIDVSTFKGRKHGLVRSLAKALAVPLLPVGAHCARCLPVLPAVSDRNAPDISSCRLTSLPRTSVMGSSVQQSSSTLASPPRAPFIGTSRSVLCTWPAAFWPRLSSSRRWNQS